MHAAGCAEPTFCALGDQGVVVKRHAHPDLFHLVPRWQLQGQQAKVKDSG